MYDILQLNDMLVPELLDIAEELKIPHAKKLNKQDLVFKILDSQAITDSKIAEPKGDGKKKKINRNDFIAAFTTLGLETKQQENIFKKMEKAKIYWLDFIEISFLSNDMKIEYKKLIQKRFDRLY